KLIPLGLYQNQIEDSGTQYLADALKTNQSLKELHLYNNQIGDNGAQRLAEALTINKVSDLLL
ncbi:unnamed protein product, partial [Rotaria socialis]